MKTNLPRLDLRFFTLLLLTSLCLTACGPFQALNGHNGSSSLSSTSNSTSNATGNPTGSNGNTNTGTGSGTNGANNNTDNNTNTATDPNPTPTASASTAVQPPTRACQVTGGVGQQTLVNDQYGACVVTSCNTGWSLAQNSCVPTVQGCLVANGNGQQTFSNGNYGACTATSCSTGYTLYQNSCYPSYQSCPIPNGTGVQPFSNGSYGTCTPVTCKPGYVVYKNQCEPSIDAALLNPIHVNIQQTSTGTLVDVSGGGTTLNPESVITMNSQPFFMLDIVNNSDTSYDNVVISGVSTVGHLAPLDGKCNISWTAPANGSVSTDKSIPPHSHVLVTISNFNLSTWKQDCQISISQWATSGKILNFKALGNL